MQVFWVNFKKRIQPANWTCLHSQFRYTKNKRKRGYFLVNIKKYGITTIFTYASCFLLPSFFPGKSAIWATIFFYLVGALLLLIVYLKSEKSFRFEQQPKNWRIILLWGILGIFIAIFSQNIVMQIETMYLGEVADSQNTDMIVQLVKSNLLFSLAVSIGGPIMEEFVFRRALTGLLQQVSPLWFSVAVSSLLFALMHLDGHILLYMSLGIIFSLLYIKTGRIWTSIISHIGMNTLVVLASILVKH